MSCEGYNVFYPSVSESIRQSVPQSCFFCRCNSTEIAPQILMKLSSYEAIGL